MSGDYGVPCPATECRGEVPETLSETVWRSAPPERPERRSGLRCIGSAGLFTVLIAGIILGCSRSSASSSERQRAAVIPRRLPAPASPTLSASSRSVGPAAASAAITSAATASAATDDIRKVRASCAESARSVAPAVATASETGPPRRRFTIDGYVERGLRIERSVGGKTALHCVYVAWPPGTTNNDGQPVNVAKTIDAGWFRAIENTLSRVPFSHVKTLKRLVIDNRPREHGIAAHDRRDPADARDGHTIFLHEHLFRKPNHWARGNYGAYYSYHANEDGVVFDNSPPQHALFSPVLLHELGHLVMYQLVNAGRDAVSVPPCAEMCGDFGTCQSLTQAEREALCISPYCMPFRFRTGTENWAEQYRFYYQSSTTRALLSKAALKCLSVLVAHDRAHEQHTAPWERGLPDIASFQKSRWDSCGGKACKAW